MAKAWGKHWGCGGTWTIADWHGKKTFLRCTKCLKGKWINQTVGR